MSAEEIEPLVIDESALVDTPGLNTPDDESDLDYLSRPENYTGGANFQAMHRVVAPKETKVETTEEENVNKPTPDQEFLYKRYIYIFPTDEEIQEVEKERSMLKTGADTESGTSGELRFEMAVPAVAEFEIADHEKRDGSPSSGTSSRGPTFNLSAGPEPSRAASGPRLSLTPGMLDNSPSMLSQMGKRGPRGSRSRIGSVGKEVKARLARERFRNAVRMVNIVVKWATSTIKKDKLSDDGSPGFPDLAKEYSYENLKNSGLHFDPNYFKAKVEINLSTEVKNILSLPSEDRTPEQIQTAMYGLRSLRSFAEYPLHMQEKLCKVAWFATVSPKRQIIRQGHLAENFYFILSGTAVVTILVKDPKTGESVTRTATIMRRGMSFGELALLHHSRRTATVTTQENVQLLTIGRDDFFDIFMSGTGPDQLPDHVRFAGQLEFMRHWPIEKLLEHPEQCLLHFFKRNAVIVKDSLDSDWLYIVKSGSCQVIKTLKGVTPKLGLRTGEHPDDHFKLPKLGTGEQGPRVDTGLRRRSPKKKAAAALHKAVTRFDDLFKQIKRSPFIPPPKQSDDRPKEGEVTEEEPKQESEVAKVKSDRFKLNATAYFRKRIHEPQARLKDRLSYKPRKKKRPKPPILPIKLNLPPSKPPPVFVQVESLNPRDVFGLETVQFDNEFGTPRTTVSLVSRGAECIMLSKEFFAKNANEAVRQTLRKLTRPYPEEGTFQENLQTKEDWNLYKTTLIEDIVKLQNEKKRLNIPLYA